MIPAASARRIRLGGTGAAPVRNSRSVPRVAVPLGLLVEQAGQLDRRPAAGGDRVPVDQLGRQRGIPGLHDHRGRAEQQDPQQAEQPGHVTGREEPQVPGAAGR